MGLGFNVYNSFIFLFQYIKSVSYKRFNRCWISCFSWNWYFINCEGCSDEKIIVKLITFEFISTHVWTNTNESDDVKGDENVVFFYSICEYYLNPILNCFLRESSLLHSILVFFLLLVIYLMIFTYTFVPYTNYYCSSRDYFVCFFFFE